MISATTLNSSFLDGDVPRSTFVFLEHQAMLLTSTLAKEKNLISFCFRSNPNVCMFDNCIVLYKLI